MGKSLLSPAFFAMRDEPLTITIEGFLKQCLRDWITLLHRISSRPTHVLELTYKEPTFVGYVDACKFGAGGVWFSGTSTLSPTVWRVVFPKSIIVNLVSQSNPHGTITNSDLEMAGLLMHWLVLECIAPHSLCHTTVGMFSDNTPTVAWTTKLCTSSSTIASYLLRALATRLHVKHANALTTHEAGVTNTMADVTSRSSRLKAYTNTTSPFLAIFSQQFPLTPQHQCWTEYHLPPKWHSLVMCCLHGKPLDLARWIALPSEGKNTGKTGQPTVDAGGSLPTSTKYPSSNAISSSRHSLLGSGLATTAAERASKLAASRKRSVPSPRPANWLDSKAQSTKHQRLTYSQWHGLWKE